ncbi:MAG: SDR family oxidoreductase [Verrucomicrobiota bacterium JB023]|nr:SDR family oxidoreductase [Verrucomicrobiota bacterium JB023]
MAQITTEDAVGVMEDPREAGARPPFPAQEMVPVPGHEKQMSPPADHGEESYVGADRLKGMVALITGGDSGIGRAIALAYAREGASVVFTYLEEENDAEETVRMVKESGAKVSSIAMDQRDEKACQDLIKQVVDEYGRLDILVNNAAFQMSYDDLESIPTEEFDRAFRTNVYGTFFLTRAALPHLPAGGSIINSASIQSFDASGGLAPYAATKAAIASFTLSFARLAAKKGVRVNAVAPGPVWTPLIPSTLPEEKVKNFGENTILGRPAQPAELAPVYVFLASKDASYVSGEIYGVTGGRMQI